MHTAQLTYTLVFVLVCLKCNMCDICYCPLYREGNAFNHIGV